MSLTTSSLITAARDFAARGSDLEVTDKMMIRALARAERAIYTQMADLNPDALAAVTTFTGVQVQAALDAGTALSLPEHYTLIDGTLRYEGYPNDPDSPLFFVPARLKDEMQEYYPAAYLLGQDLYLIRRFPAYTNSDEWTDTDTLTIRYLPVPTAPTALASELTIPDIAEDYLVLSLADFMLGAMKERDEAVTSQHLQARDALIGTLAQQDSTTTWRVRNLG